MHDPTDNIDSFIRNGIERIKDELLTAVITDLYAVFDPNKHLINIRLYVGSRQ